MLKGALRTSAASRSSIQLQSAGQQNHVSNVLSQCTGVLLEYGSPFRALQSEQPCHRYMDASMLTQQHDSKQKNEYGTINARMLSSRHKTLLSPRRRTEARTDMPASSYLLSAGHMRILIRRDLNAHMRRWHHPGLLAQRGAGRNAAIHVGHRPICPQDG